MGNGDESLDLSGKVAVVIGATGVLGGAIAWSLATAQKWPFWVANRGRQRVQEIEGQAVGASFSRLMRRIQMRSRSAKLIGQELGAVDVLVNGAGGNQDQVTVTDERKVEQILPTTGVALLISIWSEVLLLPCQEFGPAMVERGRGSIVNIASIAAHIPCLAWWPIHLLRQHSSV